MTNEIHLVKYLKYFMGIPKTYPLRKRKEVLAFKKELELLGVEVHLDVGSDVAEITEGYSRANLDSYIISHLTSNVLIPHLFNGYKRKRKERVFKEIEEQYIKYLSSPPICVCLFTGDDDFIPIAQQLESYSDGEIKVYFASHPCIASESIRSHRFINLEDINLSPPWDKGTVIATIDGNNYLNSLAIGKVQGLSHREDWSSILSITKDIFTRLNLI